MNKAILMAGVAMFFAPCHAYAQDVQSGGTARPEADSAGGIEEIIVTAQKREEKLQDVPIAITALTADSLQNAGVKSVADIGKLAVPGLVMSEQVGSPVLGLNMRGVSSQDQQQGTVEQGVALYIDGVYIPRAQGLTGELIDVERVEVLRGPQGTLFGRNAEGGAISIVSKAPTGEFGGRIGGEIGEFGSRRGYVHLDLPAVANFAVKLSGYREVFDGYTRNPRPAGSSRNLYQNFGHRDNIGGRAQVKWTPSSDFSAFYAYDRSRLKNSPQLTYNAVPTLLRATPDETFYRTAPFPYYNTDTDTRTEGHLLVLTYDVAPDITIKSITARRTLDDVGEQNLGFSLAFPIDAFGTLMTGVVAGGTVRSKTFSQELQLNGSSGDFQYTIGAFYFRENATDERTTSATIIVPPGSGPINIPLTTLVPTTIQAITTNAFAIFGQATWSPSSFDDKLKITLGGRYTEDRKSAERTQFNGVQLAVPIRPADATASRFDPALTIAYQVAPSVNVYARYAQAFRAGGVSVRSPQFLSYGPESNRQVELGLKSDLFDRRLRLNIAAFYSWIKDQQINQSTDATDPTIQNIVNAQGTTRIRGIEVEATVVPVTGLTLSGNVALQGGTQPPYNCGGCATTRIVYLPKWTAGFNGDYVTPLGDIGDLFVHVDYAYKSRYSTSPLAYPGQFFPYAHQNVWNGRIGISDIPLGNVKAKASAFVENIFDNHEIVFNTGFPFQQRRAPRRFGAELSFEF